MKNKYIQAFEDAQITSKSVPDFRAGDTLKVAIRIKEGDKSRIQNFEGTCIARRGNGVSETFIIRKIGATGMPWREFPVHIVYTDYSRAKGQSLWNSVNILVDLLFS